MLRFHRYFLAILGLAIGLTYKNISLILLASGLTGWCYPQARAAIMRCLRPEHCVRDPLSGMLVTVILFWVWMAITAFWAPPGSDIPRKLMVVFLLFGCSVGAIAFAAHVPRREARNVRGWILGGIGMGLGILCIEALSGSMIRQWLPPPEERGADIVATSRGLTVALAFMPGLLIWALPRLARQPVLHRRYGAIIAAAPVYAIIGVMALKLDVFANVVVICLLPFFLLLGGLWPRLTARWMTVTAAAIFVLSPFVANNFDRVASNFDRAYLPVTADQIPSPERFYPQTKSTLHRLIIWHFSSELILDEPTGFLFGEGARAAYNFDKKTAFFKEKAETTRRLTGFAALPTHPHNLYLEIWLEFGLVGVLLSLFFLFHLSGYLDRLLVKSRRRSHIGMMVAGLYFMFIFHAAVEMSIWRDWRVSMLSMGIFFGIICSRTSSVRTPARAPQMRQPTGQGDAE